MTDETREIKVSDIEKLVARLSRLPWGDVHDLIGFLVQLKEKGYAGRDEGSRDLRSPVAKRLQQGEICPDRPEQNGDGVGDRQATEA